MTAAAPSLDPSEVAKFSAMAAEWWNPKGKFGVLHVFNPVRLQFIKEQVTARLARDPLEREPFKGLRFLDIGCGGGLLTEPMARLGAAITGVDPSEKNIKTATVHPHEMGLDIDYRVGPAEDLAAAGEQFDVILNMEVIEHVAEPGGLQPHLRSHAEEGRADGSGPPLTPADIPATFPTRVRHSVGLAATAAPTEGERT